MVNFFVEERYEKIEYAKRLTALRASYAYCYC
jgi:hypothetical protein